MLNGSYQFICYSVSSIAKNGKAILSRSWNKYKLNLLLSHWYQNGYMKKEIDFLLFPKKIGENWKESQKCWRITLANSWKDQTPQFSTFNHISMHRLICSNKVEQSKLTTIGNFEYFIYFSSLLFRSEFLLFFGQTGEDVYAIEGLHLLIVKWCGFILPYSNIIISCWREWRRKQTEKRWNFYMIWSIHILRKLNCITSNQRRRKKKTAFSGGNIQ